MLPMDNRNTSPSAVPKASGSREKLLKSMATVHCTCQVKTDRINNLPAKQCSCPKMSDQGVFSKPWGPRSSTAVAPLQVAQKAHMWNMNHIPSRTRVEGAAIAVGQTSVEHDNNTNAPVTHSAERLLAK